MGVRNATAEDFETVKTLLLKDGASTIVVQGNKRYTTSLSTICDPNMRVSRSIIWVTIYS